MPSSAFTPTSNADQGAAACPVVLSAKELCVKKPTGEILLDNFCADFHSGELSVIFSRPGDGGPTLLQCFAGLAQPTKGQVLVCDKTPDAQLFQNRAHWPTLSLLLPHPTLISSFTVAENIRGPIGPERRVPERRRTADIIEVLELEPYLEQKAADIPLMAAQTAACARALVTGAKAILADDPTAVLSRDNAQRMMVLLASAAHDLGLCVVVRTADPDLISHADRILVLRDGRQVEDIPAPSVITLKRLALGSLSQFDESPMEDSSLAMQLPEAASTGGETQKSDLPPIPAPPVNQNRDTGLDPQNSELVARAIEILQEAR